MRRHPVLGYGKMHKGIDFAAPTGTPIYAAGEGVVKKAGRFSSFGNYVRIKHRGDLDTAYAHMSKIASGLRPGARVKQGQIIGYVGTTGRSTGPHLHYEIMVAGKQVNPRGVNLPVGHALAGRDMKKFKATINEIESQFASISGAAVKVAQRQVETGEDVN
jgi:murein DD-endopeptidase MepM/ murein hydrolase activator NlpD